MEQLGMKNIKCVYCMGHGFIYFPNIAERTVCICQHSVIEEINFEPDRAVIRNWCSKAEPACDQAWEKNR